MQNVLVTGGAGFIGSHVVRAFLERGARVTVLDNLSSGKQGNLPDSVDLIEADVRSEQATKLVSKANYDVVCHLAAQIDVRRSLLDPKFDADVNVAGTINLLEAVKASGNLATRFIFSSTAAVYGDPPALPINEGAAKEPFSPYGIGKLGSEYYLGYYARVHGLKTVALRYSNVYGPRQDSHGEAGVVAIFCERILDGRPLTIYGDGRQTRDFVYAGDVAAANVQAAVAPIHDGVTVDSRAFNVATQTETDIVSLATMLKNIAGSDAAIEHGPDRAGEIQRSVLESRKAQSHLEWTPQITLKHGLAETFHWFAEQQHVRKPSAGIPSALA